MTIKQLVSELCKREGKKSQVKVGDAREVLRILTDMTVEYLLVGPGKGKESPCVIIHHAATGKIKRMGKKVYKA